MMRPTLHPPPPLGSQPGAPPVTPLPTGGLGGKRRGRRRAGEDDGRNTSQPWSVATATKPRRESGLRGEGRESKGGEE